MINYPLEIFEAYAKRQISKEEFIKQFSRWQEMSGLDYTCKKTVDSSGVYFTYRNITATIKDDKLHFKTYQNDTAKTPFEFRRKVDFYLEQKDRAILKALSTMSFYFEKAIKIIHNLEINDYQANTVFKHIYDCIEKAEYWAEIERERMVWL